MNGMVISICEHDIVLFLFELIVFEQSSSIHDFVHRLWSPIFAVFG